jgi:hypothetical protein
MSIFHTRRSRLVAQIELSRTRWSKSSVIHVSCVPTHRKSTVPQLLSLTPDNGLSAYPAQEGQNIKDTWITPPSQGAAERYS